jgi:hypothetical protein
VHQCNFCLRDDFPSRQSFFAHLKWCDAYLQHKRERKAATSLREAVPKAQPETTSPPTPLPHTNDPFAPLMQALQDAGLRSPKNGEAQETTQQRIRRL